MVMPFAGRLAAFTSHFGAVAVVGSRGSGPMRMLMMIAQSSAVRANGPTVSSVNESGMQFARLTRLLVGLKPEVPQKCAGRRIEPPVSEPSAAGTSRAPTAEPEPEDEPPVMRVGSHGLQTWPVWTLWPVGP